jgi:glycosyltransferase involved in cell wall biosynthesis
MKKILFMPPEPWYVEVHMEYLIRYLGGEYLMEQGNPGNPKENPLYKNPDDYDLLVPLLATHHRLPWQQYGKKMATILWEPREGCWSNTVYCAATTPLVVRAMENDNYDRFIEVTPGIDTQLFQPFPQARADSLLRVGVIGCMHNVRHRVKEIVLPLLDIPGVKFDFYTRNFFADRQNDTEEAGGEKFTANVVDGNKRWVGIPNLYNRMDVLLKVDADPGLTFPVMEAAACGVPVIATDIGIEEVFARKGALWLIDADEVDNDGNGRSWYLGNTARVIERCRKAIEWMRDNPEKRKEMGKLGRQAVLDLYTWEKQLPKWREFFDKALSYVQE